MKPRWQAKLARPITLIDGTKLATLADVRHFILEELTDADRERAAWMRAAELLLEAAERDGSIATATKQVEDALYLQMKWMPPQ